MPDVKGIADETLLRHRAEVIALAARHGVSDIRVFGSRARGEARPDSDVDLLVRIEHGRGMFDIGRLLLDLEALLGCKVDLVTEGALHHTLREQILGEATPL